MSKDYDVGYKKPPKHTQFKKGRSGNPKGRPKKDLKEEKTVATILDEIRVPVNTPHGTVEYTALEVALRKLVESAAKGSVPAAKLILNTSSSHGKDYKQEAVIRALREELRSVYDELEKLKKQKQGGVLVVPAKLSPQEFIKEAKKHKDNLKNKPRHVDP